LNDVPQEQLDSYAEAILANEKEGRRIVEKTEQDKVIGWVKSVVTLDEKEISIEDLQAMNN
jgi:trigger factor